MRTTLTLALLAALAALPARAKEQDAALGGKAIVHRVQKFYRHAKDFTAAFDQHYTYLAFGRTQESTGKVQVKKPGLLHWENDKPEKQVMVLDGKDFWQHSPEDNQVTVRRGFSGGQLSSAFTFLWGKGDLLKEFTAHAVPHPEGLPPGDAVELIPREPQAAVAKLVFVVGKRGEVLASVVTNSQGDTNRLVFHDVKLNVALPDSTFKFTPPPGANVSELK